MGWLVNKMNAKRTEVIGDCTLYLGDCLPVMANFKEKSIDMIWTDPPYGHANHDGDLNSQLNKHRGIEDKPIENDTMDKMREVVDLMLLYATKLLKDDCCCCCCCCCGGGPKPTFAWLAKRMDSQGMEFFHSVIWDKKNPGLGWRYRRQHEMVMVAHKKGSKLLWADNDVAARNIFSFSPPRNRIHPNEKPIELVNYFLELHASKGETILDPFMGSGTTGLSCIKNNLKFIGIELDEEHFDAACRRIEKAYKTRPRLFCAVEKKQEKQLNLF